MGQYRPSALSSSAKADDPVITIASVSDFTRIEYWMPRMRGA
jgi:hypothetical protein